MLLELKQYLLLIYINSSLPTGSVDLRYKLGLITHKYQLTHRNLADGFPHYINITRHNRTIKTQVYTLSVATVKITISYLFFFCDSFTEIL